MRMRNDRNQKWFQLLCDQERECENRSGKWRKSFLAADEEKDARLVKPYCSLSAGKCPLLFGSFDTHQVNAKECNKTFLLMYGHSFPFTQNWSLSVLP